MRRPPAPHVALVAEQPAPPAAVVAAPAARRHPVEGHLLEAEAFEEGADARLGREPVDRVQLLRARAAQGEGDEVLAHALAQEARQRVERRDLASPGRVGEGEQRADAGQVRALHEGAEAVGQHLVDGARRARRQVSLRDAAADQVVGGVEVVEAELAHHHVALAREERPRAGVGEELAVEAGRVADVHRRHPPLDHRGDLAQEGAPALRQAPACRQELVQLVEVHEGEPASAPVPEPPARVDPHQLADPEPERELPDLSGKGLPPSGHDPHPRGLPQAAPDHGLEGTGGGRDHPLARQPVEGGPARGDQQDPAAVAGQGRDHRPHGLGLPEQLLVGAGDGEGPSPEALQVELALGEAGALARVDHGRALWRIRPSFTGIEPAGAGPAAPPSSPDATAPAGSGTYHMEAPATVSASLRSPEPPSDTASEAPRRQGLPRGAPERSLPGPKKGDGSSPDPKKLWKWPLDLERMPGCSDAPRTAGEKRPSQARRACGPPRTPRRKPDTAPILHRARPEGRGDGHRWL